MGKTIMLFQCTAISRLPPTSYRSLSVPDVFQSSCTEQLSFPHWHDFQLFFHFISSLMIVHSTASGHTLHMVICCAQQNTCKIPFLQQIKCQSELLDHDYHIVHIVELATHWRDLCMSYLTFLSSVGLWMMRRDFYSKRDRFQQQMSQVNYFLIVWGFKTINKWKTSTLIRQTQIQPCICGLSACVGKNVKRGVLHKLFFFFLFVILVSFADFVHHCKLFGALPLTTALW